MANSYSVEAYLRATGADQFSRAFQNAGRDVQGLERNSGIASVTIGGMLKALAGTAAAVAGINMLKNSIDGAITRYDTLNTFPRILELMGFDAKSSSKAINDLSKGIEGLPTTLDDVARTTQRIAGMTGDLGGAVDTTLALNNAFLASGSSSADASRGLTQYVQMLAKGKVDMMSWRTLQETMPMALMKTAEAFGFTGTSAQNDFYEALKSGEVTFDQFNDKLIELSNATGGFADMAAESSSGIRTSWTNMKTAIVRNVASMIGAIDQAMGGVGSIAGVLDQMKVAIDAAFSYVIATMPKVFSVLQQIGEAIRPWLPLIVGVVTAFLTFNTIIAVMAKVKIAIAATKVAFAAFNAVVAANPIVLIIALIAGLAVALYMLYQRSETVRAGVDAAFSYIRDIVTQVVQYVTAFVMQVWGMMVSWWNENNQSIMAVVMTVWTFVQNIIQTVVQAVVSFVMTIWAQLTAFWSEHGQMILQAAQNVWNVITTVVTTAVTIIWTIIQKMASIVSSVMQFLWPFIQALVTSVWNNIKGVIQGAITVITGIIQFFAALFTGNWTQLWDAVKNILSGAVQLLWNLVQLWFVGKIVKVGATFAKAFSGGIKSMWETIRIIFMYAVDFVRNFVLRGFTAIRTSVTTIMNAIRSVITTVWNAIRSFITGILNGIRSVFTNIFNAIRNVVSTVFNAIRSVISNIMNAIRSVISNILNGIRGTVSNILNSIRSTFTNIFNALRNIVSTAFNAVRSAISSGMSNALSTITGFMGRFTTAGRNIVTSIANGIKGAIGKVTGAISSVTQKIRNFLPFSPAKEGALRDIMKVQVGESIAKAIDRGRSAAVGSMSSLAQAVENEMPNAKIAMDVGAAHRSSHRNMSYDLHNSLDVAKQPAHITLDLGGRSYRTFIEDITDAQVKKANLSVRFGGE